MPNRDTRDEIIRSALGIVHLPRLEAHDMPNGIVQPDAYSIQWLQDILDFWYHQCPFSATVGSVELNCTAGSDTIVLPEDFILDVKHGYTVETIPGDPKSKARRYRLDFQKFLTKKLANQKATNVNYPNYYCVQGSIVLNDAKNNTALQTLKVTPTPSIDTQGELWYYQLPPKLRAGDVPLFPNDYVCKEYIRIRALEWANAIEPGTAQKFCDRILGTMRANGLLNEPEDTEIPMDPEQFVRGSYTRSPFAWMGPQ